MKKNQKLLVLILSILMLFSALSIQTYAYLGTETKNLINSASLTPMKTGYTPLDNLITKFFNANFKSSMTTYDKVKICYDFLVYNSVYGDASTTYSLYNAIDKECGHYSRYDRRYTAEAYAFITTKQGTCVDFAGAFMVMSRAIGLETYVMDGTISWAGGSNEHTWCLIKLGGKYYTFDPQAEWRNYDNNGSVSYSNFCIPESSQTSRKYDRDKCIAYFGNFKCANKTNNPGVTTPGTTASNDAVTYKTGIYVTEDAMYFRSNHSTTASSYFVIPEGTTLTITEVYGVWGKTTYDGKTGWLSLEYSKYTGAAPSTDSLPGDVNGDKKVDASDARLILRHSVQLEKINSKYLKNADLNADGKIDSSDARLALRKSVGLD